MAFPWAIAAKYGIPLAASFLGNIFSKKKSAEPAQQQPQFQVPQLPQMNFNTSQNMSYEQSLERAGNALNPMFDQHLGKTMDAVDRKNLQSGFYGQMPGDALKGSRAAQVQADRVSQIAQMGQGMYNQDYNRMMQQQQMAANYNMAGANLGLSQQQANMQQQQLGMQQSQANQNKWNNIFDKGMGIYMTHSNAANTQPFTWLADTLGWSKAPQRNTVEGSTFEGDTMDNPHYNQLTPY